jgi:hypothetical protein
MDSAWQDYSRAHALVVDPYERVGIIRNTSMDMWSASITRAVVMTSSRKVISRTFKVLFKINRDDYIISLLWNATIDEIDYTMYIIELLPAFAFSVLKHVHVKFIPINKVLDEILNEDRAYSNDSVRVFTHLSSYIEKGICRLTSKKEK